MKIFAAVFINNLRRLAQRKSRIILFFIFTAGAVAAAAFFNSKAEIAGRIAVVSESGADIPISSTPHLNIATLEKPPAMSELAAGKYDAAVVFDGSGGYAILTVKNDDFRQMIAAIIADPSSFSPKQADSRGRGTNILGFLMMFVFMQGISITFMFTEDKDKKQIKRIAASPVPFPQYLCAHSLFAYLFILVPTMATILAAHYAFGVDIGLKIMDFFLLLAALCALSVSFALFLDAMAKDGDSANMIGSAVIVLTSALAGSFYSFEKGNKILEAIIKVLPQKAFLSMSELIEQGKGISLWYHYGLYIAILAVLFFAAAAIKTRHDYVKG